MKQSTLVTSFTEFYRATNADKEVRHFAVGVRDKARAFDEAGDPAIVKGYGVYDTTVSTEYAVALYGSHDEATRHEGAEAPAAPETIIDAPESNDENEDPAPTHGTRSGRFGSKRKN